MVNKKGYLKTIEAVIAIVLILVFIVTIWPKSQDIEAQIPREIALTLDRVLDEFQYNSGYRDCILVIEPTYTPETLPENDLAPPKKSQSQCYDELNEFITKNLPLPLSYAMSICLADGSACIPQDVEVNLPRENIYTKSAFISASLESINPKTIKIYIWRKA